MRVRRIVEEREAADTCTRRRSVSIAHSADGGRPNSANVGPESRTAEWTQDRAAWTITPGSFEKRSTLLDMIALIADVVRRLRCVREELRRSCLIVSH